MTEAEWLECQDPEPMLAELYDTATARKLRLFGAACVRRIWHLLFDARSRQVVEVGERFADGLAGDVELEAAAALASAVAEEYSLRAWDEAAINAADAAASTVMDGEGGIFCYAFPITVCAAKAIEDVGPGDAYSERAAQAALLREVFGTMPFRSSPPHPRWLTPPVVELARAIYDGGTYDRMPELAQSLKNAGCKDTELLAHFRTPGEHVRGCWALDIVLGKE